MSKKLPPLDMHAHIDPKSSKRSLEELGAVVFAATRSLEEFKMTIHRDDQVTVWGAGCHPGVKKAQETFSAKRFLELIEYTAFVGEIGLDGSSKVPMLQQIETFSNILECLSEKQRVTSIHSRRASAKVLNLLEEHPVQGVILHWWSGNSHETARAIELGCWFSVNASARDDIISSIPLDRLLVETDHPHGNSKGEDFKQPGYVLGIEHQLAKLHDQNPDEIRIQIWHNFIKLVEECHVQEMMTQPISRMIEHCKTL